MNLKEVGIYLRTLREAQRLTREDVAQSAETSVSQVERIENGKQETRSSVMLALLQAVDGSADDLQYLLLSPGVHPGDGRRMALARLTMLQTAMTHTPSAVQLNDILTETQIEHYTAFLDSLSQDELKALIAFTQRLQDDPEKRKTLRELFQADARTISLLKLYLHAHQRGQQDQDSSVAPQVAPEQPG